MTEVLFILTTIFVAYVVYTIVSEQQPLNKAVKPRIAPEVQAIIAPPVPQIVTKEPVAAVIKAVDKPVVVNTGKGAVRNPTTGEVTTIANNYRFIKRWIKDALVTEGLLEKIYKNNELDESAEALIKQALVKFEAMDKYRA